MNARGMFLQMPERGESMTERKRQIWTCVWAFALLFLVSLYRQLSLRLLPHDPLRTYILYACYVCLLGGWAVSLKSRIVTKSMRVFLIADAAVMLLGLTVRFLQDTYWQQNIALTRLSGLFVLATILPMLTLGFFASLGAGKPDDFRVALPWYLLLLPVALVTALIVWDEQFHFMFYLDPSEAQPNLNFHPNTGTFLVVLLSFLMVILRVLLIYRRNRSFTQSRLLRIFIPLFEPILTVLFTLEYFVVSLGLIPALRGMEVIELYAKIYAIEVLTWEFYIYIGLVPVNVEYQDIFEHADIGMQIVGDDGSRIRSRAATEVSPEQMDRLEAQGFLSLSQGTELHAHRIEGGMLLWNKDVSGLQSTIAQLQESAEVLSQEGALLEEEWKARDRETRLAAQNQVYDQLTNEVRDRLRRIRETAGRLSPDGENAEALHQLALLGTYVKRRCNLRILQLDSEAGTISPEDLRYSLQDMLDALRWAGIPAALQWRVTKPYSPAFSILLVDMLEALLEASGFSAREVTVETSDGKACLALTADFPAPRDQSILPAVPPGCGMEWEWLPDGVKVTLGEGGAYHAA